MSTGVLVNGTMWESMRAVVLLGLLALVFGGCDDGTGSGGGNNDGGAGDTGAGGEGGEGGEGGGGEGGEGGGGPCVGECVTHDECGSTQYCRVAEGEVLGCCAEGCRDDSSCDAGQVCNQQTRRCEQGPCETDDACAEGQYCDTDSGNCLMGCRTNPDTCPAGSVCDATTRECQGLVPCCSEDQTCSMTTAGACGGSVLEGVADCSQDPCVRPDGPDDRCDEDSDCPDGRYCNTRDGTCPLGCRADDPSTCPPGQICDTEKHTCEDVPCEADVDCPPGDRGAYCDDGVCAIGCMQDPHCPEGYSCDNGSCVEGERCDPQAVDPCDPGQYCDPQQQICREECGGHGDCEANEFCNPENQHCEVGCRNDIGEGGEPGNDEIAGALALLLAPQPDGTRVGSIQMRRICGRDSDFFAVSLEEGERMRIEVRYLAGEGNVDLRLHGDAVEDGPIEAATLNIPEVIVYPAFGVELPASDYHIEVFGNVEGVAGLTYEVRVVAVGGGEGPNNPGACFPDPREAGQGDDLPETATRIQDPGIFNDATICRGDEDWYVFPMGINAGLTVDSTATAAVPENDLGLRIELFSASRINQAGGLANPNFRVDNAQNIPEGIRYLFQQAADQGLFSNEDWYVRVLARNPQTVVEYRITIDPELGGDCGNDGGTEPNNNIASAVDLDALLGGAPIAGDRDHEVNLDLEICARDEDFFCFTADTNDILEAWVVSNDVAGQLVVQFFDRQGQPTGRQGRHTAPGAPTDPARVAGATEGRWCFHVDGLAAAQGTYDLFVRRTLTDGECGGLDFAEVDGRNDGTFTSTPLPDVSGGMGLRFQFDDGVICDNNGPDVDWYHFPVARDNSRICTVIDGFNDAEADLDLHLFRQDAGGPVCQANNPQCAAGSVCIPTQLPNPAGRCSTPVGVSATNYDVELVDLNKDISGGPGTLFARVSRDGDGVPQGYSMTVTVTPEPEGEVCERDWREIESPNDDANDATYLGAGQFATCDTWVCDSERFNGDWYRITVPQNQDRTLLIQYSNNTDGRLFLNCQGPPTDPSDIFSGYRSSLILAGNHQCINIRGGAMPHDIECQVELDLIHNDTDDPTDENGDNRVDYSLRVLRTNIDARPQGECVLLGAANLGSCDPDEPFAENCWPLYELP